MSQQTPKNRVLFVRSLWLSLLVLFGVFSLLALGLRSPQSAQAATSSTINFQSRLETSSGAIAPDGSYNVEFKLYSAASGGTAEWTEDYTYNSGAGSTDARLRVANGYLSASLGSITPFPNTIDWTQQQWITMNIGGTVSTGTITWDGEMSPRLQLTAVPYAFAAGQLQTTSGSNTSTLTIQAPTGGNQTFVIQNQGAAGTYNLLTSGNGVQLQTSTPGTAQTGNFNVSGTGMMGSLQVGTSRQFQVDTSGNVTTTGTYNTDTFTAASLLFGSSANSTIGLSAAAAGTAGGNLTIVAGTSGSGSVNGGNLLLQGGKSGGIGTSGSVIVQANTNDSATAFQILTANGNRALNVDTTSSTITIGSSNTNSTLVNDSLTTNPPSGSLYNSATWVSGQYVQLTPATNASNGELNYVLPIANYDATFQFRTTGSADATWLYAYDTAVPTRYDTAAGGYSVVYDEYLNYIWLYYNGTQLAQVTQNGMNDGNWHSAEVVISGTNIKVYLDSVLQINYTDSARTFTGQDFGFGAQTGGLNATHQIRNVLVTSAGSPVNSALRVDGTATVQSLNNSTSAFQVQNASGVSVLGVDTTTGILNLGTASTSSGSIKLYSSAGSGSVALMLASPGSNNYTLSIPTLTGNDTICTVGTGCGGSGVTTVGTFSATSLVNGASISGSTITFGPADGTNPGMVTASGNQTFGGNKTFSGNTTLNNTTLAASSSITITGGITSTRPASPTAGMLYYDSTTNQLLQYNGSKWVSSPRSNTLIVAASNSTQAEKDAADYVATGTSDQTTINSALSALPAGGGSVYLMEGTYTLSAAISVPNNTALIGGGASSILTIPNAQNGSYNMIQSTDTTTGARVTIQNLLIDGNRANQTAGNMDGLNFTSNMGGGSGASAREGAKISSLVVRNVSSYGIEINGSNNIISNNTVTNGGNVGINAAGSYNVISNNVVQGGVTGIVVNGSGAYNTITGNVVSGAASNGIYTIQSTNDSLTGNTLINNSIGIYILNSGKENIAGNSVTGGPTAIDVKTSSYSTITGNNVQGSSTYGLRLEAGANNNNITGNKIHDIGSSTANNGIYVTSSSGNTIASNDITDTSCTSTCYAINISDSTSQSNYLANNNYSGTAINLASIYDSGTGTIYANQQDANGNLINKSQGGGFTIGAASATASLSLQGGFVSAQLPAPTLSAAITNAGTAGTTSYSYQVTALDGTGETTGSAVQTTTTGNATLSTTNYNTITWTAVPGAVQYNIYRCTGASCAPAKLATVAGNATSYNDQAAGTPSGAVPGTNTTGNATFAGALQGTAGTFTSGTLTLGTASTSSGSIKLFSSAASGSVTLALNNPGTGNYTLSIPTLTGNDTICTVGAANCGGGGGGGISTVGTFSASSIINGASISGSTITFGPADATNPGMVTASGNQTFGGNKTFSGNTTLNNTTLAAGTSITLTGGITSARPASPTAGMLYYDTSTNQLLQYNGGKWVADRTNAIIVAASNSTQAEKDAADYVATGTDDGTMINSALADANPSGSGRKVGQVILLAGTYTLGATSISVPNNTTLAGVGAGTLLTYPAAMANATYYAITNTTTGGTGTHVVVRDLQIDGNKSGQTTGTFDGIYFNGVGSGSGSSAVAGGTITNVTVKNVFGASSVGIYLSASSNNVISGNTVANSAAYGIELAISAHNSLTGNVAQGNGSMGIVINSSSPGNSLTGNIAQGNGSNGIDVSGNGTVNTTITANTVSGNGSVGIHVNGQHALISSNFVQGNGTYGIYLGFGNNNTIKSNQVDDNGGASTNNGIYLDISSSQNTISNNTISDTSCTTNCYAININDSGSTGNYLSNNTYTGTTANAASIRDLGTGTIYANQADGSGNLINKSQGGGFTIGASSASASLSLQGGLVSTQLPAPTLSATIANAGTAGTTSYSYQVTALDGTGETTGSAVQTTTTGNATLSTTNYNTITWTAVPGAVQYNIYRCTGASCTPAKLATVAGNATSYNDQAAGSPSGSTPVSNTTGNATFAGALQGTAATLTSGTLKLGTASTSTGSIKLFSSAGTGSVTLTLSNPGTGNYTLSIPTLTGNDTICTVGAANCGGGGGGGSHTKTIQLTAEYAGAVFNASNDATCAAANTGYMTSDLYNSGNTFYNFYKWAGNNGATTQCYDVSVRVPIPSDFGSWAAAPTVMGLSSDGTAALNVDVRDTAGAQDGTAYQSVTGLGTNTWSTATLGSLTGTYTPGGTMTIRIRMSASSTDYVELGNLTLTYTSAY